MSDIGVTSDAPAPPIIDHVVIVGAGFSGTLQAINLLRHQGPRVTLIERRPEPARGVAYSTLYPGHLLNVRAANMSALPDDPGHFARWLAAREHGTPASFAPRAVFGDYLVAQLAEAAAREPGRLTVLCDNAVEIDADAQGVRVALEGGGAVAADAAVLALGNLPPHDPPGFGDADLPDDLYVSDPWQPGALDGLADDDDVLVIGTGLTMVDVALLLDARGFRGRIVALSRRGLAPRAHADAHPPGLSERPAERGALLVDVVRRRAAEIGWREAVDELRPYTQSMWLSATHQEQARFLRHLRAWWDVHRHRIAPPVAARIQAMRAAGRLEIAAGKVSRVVPGDGQVAVSWRERGGESMRTLAARRVINCTGPQGDLLRTREPLLRLLLAGGHIRPDAHRLGLDVTPQGEVIDAAGRANPRLFALGPMTRGTFWEIVAVPDIRVQTWSVARRLSNAHWVEGRGL